MSMTHAELVEMKEDIASLMSSVAEDDVLTGEQILQWLAEVAQEAAKIARPFQAAELSRMTKLMAPGGY